MPPACIRTYGDPEAMRFWDAPPNRTVAETREDLQRSLAADTASHAAWAVLARDGEAFIGMVNYHARQPRMRRLAVGWVLVRRFQAQGLMQEAMAALLSHCFAALDTHRVEAEIEPGNQRSIRLAERLGFRPEGLLRDRMWVADQPRSLWMYALLRPEWHAATTTTAA